MKQNYHSKIEPSLDKQIALLFSINKQPSEDALQSYNAWLQDQSENRDVDILGMLHVSIHYGWENTVKTILSSEAGCLAILSDESLLVQATNTNNLKIINALYNYRKEMSSEPIEDSKSEDTIQGHIVDAFQDRQGNLHPGGGSSSSNWKEVKAFQTTTGDLIELTPDLMAQISNEPNSKKRSASELEDPIQHKQIKIEGMPEAVYQDQEGRFNIDADASLEEIIQAQEFLQIQLELAESFVQNHSLPEENTLDPLTILAGVAAMHNSI